MSKHSDIIPNRVFVGCPWHNIRPKYVDVIHSLEKSYPLHFILIGREEDQRAEELLALIKKNLLSSSWAIFDVTRGNPNVSLEYGIADASEIERSLYLNVRKQQGSTDRDTAIIADLAGQRRRQYKNKKALAGLLSEFCRNHNFSKRFDSGFKKITRNIKSRHNKKSYRTLAIKIIRCLDGRDRIRRADLTENLRGQDYKDSDIEFMLKGLREHKLISIETGRYADVVLA